MTRRTIATIYLPIPVDVITTLIKAFEWHWPEGTVQPNADGTAFEVVLEELS